MDSMLNGHYEQLDFDRQLRKNSHFPNNKSNANGVQEEREGLSNKGNEDEDSQSVFSFNFLNDEPTNNSHPKKKPS